MENKEFKFGFQPSALVDLFLGILPSLGIDLLLMLAHSWSLIETLFTESIILPSSFAKTSECAREVRI